MPHPLRDDGLPGSRWGPYALIVAAIAATYANALEAGFQFDDWNVIVDDPRVKTFAAWWESMPGIRPLLKLSYVLNFAFDAGPAGFHAVNVAIHAANACLVFALVARWKTRGVALAAALLFALHPVQTEAVTYVSGRSTSMMAFFALASILAWAHGRRRVLSPACFAVALMVKETAFVVPLALVLVDVASGVRIRRPVAHIAVLIAAAAFALALPVYRHLLAVSFATRDVGVNLLTQAHAVTYLAGQTVRLDRLNADPALPVVETWGWGIAADAAMLFAALALGIACMRRHPVTGAGILWFFVWLLPTNSVLPRLDVVNDRQLYVALAGPAWLAASALGWFAAKRRNAIVATIVVAAATGLGVATHRRNLVYGDEVAFWSDVAEKTPGNGRAFNNLGYALALAGRRAEADEALRRALAIDPNDFRAAVNLRLLREGILERSADRR